MRKVFGIATLLLAATTSDLGKVVCNYGHLHTAKTTVPSGCTAVGILGHVTETGHGLILALYDATDQTWNTINGWESTTKYASTTLKVLPDLAARGAYLSFYRSLGASPVSNWAVAQRNDYCQIFRNLGCDEKYADFNSDVNAYITGAGGNNLLDGHSDIYWSATGISSNTAYVFSAYDGKEYKKEYTFHIRPVLGF